MWLIVREDRGDDEDMFRCRMMFELGMVGCLELRDGLFSIC